MPTAATAGLANVEKQSAAAATTATCMKVRNTACSRAGSTAGAGAGVKPLSSAHHAVAASTT